MHTIAKMEKMVDDTTLPELNGEKRAAGVVELSPCSVSFIVTE